MRVLLFFLCLFSCYSAFCSLTFGGFVLQVGDHNLQPNAAGQRIDLFLSSTASTDPVLNGMNFRARLGDGSGTQGVFTGIPGSASGVVLTGGSYFWDGVANGSTIGGQGPVLGAPAFAEISVNFNNSGNSQVLRSIGTDGPVRIASLLVDTTGLFSGTYAIDLSDSLTVGIGPTNLIGQGGSEIGIGITNGRFQITAVPEPSSLIFSIMVAVFGLVFSRTGISRWLRERNLSPC
jgi:hypothetical protein